MVVALLATLPLLPVQRYSDAAVWRFQASLTPKYLLYYSSTKTINKRTTYPTYLLGFLRGSFDSFRLLLRRADLQNNVILPATCLLENAVTCDKKSVFAASLEGQLCQIQLLINKSDTSSETHITTTQHRFKSQIGYAKTIDLKR